MPAALVISALAPWAVLALLMIGGAFLCYEGFEKVAHRLTRANDEDDALHAALGRAVADPALDRVAMEKEKIKGAVRTDFILSAEIIVITLGTVAASPFVTQVSVLIGIAIIMTVGVYGLVAGIVKLDDGGLSLSRTTGDSNSCPHDARRGDRRGLVCAVAHEGPLCRRHCGDVPCRRRHPRARHTLAA